MRIEDFSSCGEESCDSSNCSHCEAAMDRPFPFQPTFRCSPTKQHSSGSSGNVSPDFTKNTVSCSTDSKTMILSEQHGSDCETTSPLSLCFRESCQIDQDTENINKQEESTAESCAQCQDHQGKDTIGQDLLNSASTSTLKSSAEKSKFESASADGKSTDSNSSLDELGYGSYLLVSKYLFNWFIR